MEPPVIGSNGVSSGLRSEHFGRRFLPCFRLHPRLDDSLLGGIGRRAWAQDEAIPLSALSVGAMHLRIIDHGARDRALGVVDDDLGRHAAEVAQPAVMATLPGLGTLVEDEFAVLTP